jgi:hypothetical protein
MKKLVITITALVYLTVASGATVNLHYCMGKLMSWNLSLKNKGKCGSCGMEKTGHKGCCHDEHKQLKVDKDQKASESAFQFLSISCVAITATHTELPLIYSSNLVAENPSAHGPPGIGGVPIFILNRNFRI